MSDDLKNNTKSKSHKGIALHLILILMFIFLTGCGKKTVQEETQQELNADQIYIYYVNHEKTDMVQAVYTLNSENDLDSNVDELISHLTTMETTTECQSPIPDNFIYLDNPIENVGGRIEVAFNVIYENISPEALLFFKGCVSKTLLQLEGVSKVSISMTDIASQDPETATVNETFDEDSFIMSFGDTIGNKQKGTIVLYFANESGDSLKEYRKSVEISNTASLGRTVVESLIEGPHREGYQATISEGTTIQNIAAKDGIYYVDLSEEFYNTDNPLKNDIIVYSIVNSLVELPTISKVQFLKNGEKIQFYRETLPFDGLFERNLDIIEQEGQQNN